MQISFDRSVNTENIEITDRCSDDIGIHADLFIAMLIHCMVLLLDGCEAAHLAVSASLRFL
jgi:hypothetical protein